MNIVGALVGVHRLQVRHVAHHRVLVEDAVGAVDVAGGAGDLQGDVDVVHLGQGDLLGDELALVLDAAGVQRQELALRDLAEHPGELHLNELERRDGLVELDAGLGVLDGRVVTGHRRAERAPGDAKAGVVEARERPTEALHAGEQAILGDAAVLEDELGGDRGLQGVFAVHLRRGEARVTLLDDEAADLAVELRPDHGDMRQGAVGDPHLRAVEHVAVAVIDGLGQHAARVRAEVGLGEAEAADHAAGGHLGEVLQPLGFSAEAADGVHREAALHRDEAAQARVAALQLLADQAVGDVGHARAAVALDVGAQKPHLADLGDEVHREGARATVLLDDRDDAVIHPAPNEVADGALLIRELRVDVVEVHAGELLHDGLRLWRDGGCRGVRTLLIRGEPGRLVISHRRSR
ncbi:MAG: hypothetical protein RLZZ620_1147 [Pseudomonadota bacterium]